MSNLLTNICKSEPSTSKILVNVASNILYNALNGESSISENNIVNPISMFVDRTLDNLCKVTKEAFCEVLAEEIETDKAIMKYINQQYSKK